MLYIYVCVCYIYIYIYDLNFKIVKSVCSVVFLIFSANIHIPNFKWC